MNPKIKALEQQCWSHRVNGVLVDGHSHFDAAKFAELIVLKCAEIADTAEPFLASDLIKQHFGVKE